jgi:hypothetical protein
MAVIVHPQKISRKKVRGWTPESEISGHQGTPNLKISGHQGGHQAAKLLRRKELVPKKGLEVPSFLQISDSQGT